MTVTSVFAQTNVAGNDDARVLFPDQLDGEDGRALGVVAGAADGVLDGLDGHAKDDDRLEACGDERVEVFWQGVDSPAIHPMSVVSLTLTWSPPQVSPTA